MAYRLLLVSIFTLFVSRFAFGAGWVEEQTIRIVGMEPDSAVVWVSSPYTSNPNNCTGQPLDLAILPKTNASFKEIYAALLSASLAGKRMNFRTSGCIEAWGATYPQIDNIRVFP